MDPGAAIAMLIVLIVAIAAIVYVIRKGAKCPPAPAAISFWTTPDQSAVPTTISCPAGTTIAVQGADYGAPWTGCAWTPVTAQAKNFMNGQASYTIPAGANLATTFGITPCVGTTGTFSGAYVCMAPVPP
jgi:hypothetical protein